MKIRTNGSSYAVQNARGSWTTFSEDGIPDGIYETSDIETWEGWREEALAQTVDFDTVVRSMLDTCTAGDRAGDVADRAFKTSCWMANRGVVITLDGAPFSPGNLSPDRAARLIEDRGLFEDEDAS